MKDAENREEDEFDSEPVISSESGPRKGKSPRSEKTGPNKVVVIGVAVGVTFLVLIAGALLYNRSHANYRPQLNMAAVPPAGGPGQPGLTYNGNYYPSPGQSRTISAGGPANGISPVSKMGQMASPSNLPSMGKMTTAVSSPTLPKTSEPEANLDQKDRKLLEKSLSDSESVNSTLRVIVSDLNSVQAELAKEQKMLKKPVKKHYKKVRTKWHPKKHHVARSVSPPKIPAYVLVGVVGDSAWIRRTADKSMFELKKGSSFEGTSVDVLKIANDGVVLSNGVILRPGKK